MGALIEDGGGYPGAHTNADRISGSFTLANPLDALPFTEIAPSILSILFTDGRFTYTNPLDADSMSVRVATDAAGNITDWDLRLGVI
jgi:hypothetical protein